MSPTLKPLALATVIVLAPFSAPPTTLTTGVEEKSPTVLPIEMAAQSVVRWSMMVTPWPDPRRVTFDRPIETTPLVR
jgi:hypothetical protein